MARNERPGIAEHARNHGEHSAAKQYEMAEVGGGTYQILVRFYGKSILVERK